MSLRLQQGLALGAGLVVAAVMMWLGVWQMSSYEESTRDVSAERAAEAPTPLAEAVAADGEVQDIYGKRVSFTGRYLPEYEATVGTSSPWRVLTLMQLDDGRHIAVVRGAIDAGADEAVPAPPTGRQDVEGVFLAPDFPEDVSGDGPTADHTSVRIQELAQEWPSPLIAGYVTLPAAEAAAQGLGEAPLVLPAAEGSPTHRGYALQWWVFAAGAVAFGVYTARQLGREQRR